MSAPTEAASWVLQQEGATVGRRRTEWTAGAPGRLSRSLALSLDAASAPLLHLPSRVDPKVWSDLSRVEARLRPRVTLSGRTQAQGVPARPPNDGSCSETVLALVSCQDERSWFLRPAAQGLADTPQGPGDVASERDPRADVTRSGLVASRRWQRSAGVPGAAAEAFRGWRASRPSSGGSQRAPPLRPAIGGDGARGRQGQGPAPPGGAPAAPSRPGAPGKEPRGRSCGDAVCRPERSAAAWGHGLAGSRCP